MCCSSRDKVPANITFIIKGKDKVLAIPDVLCARCSVCGNFFFSFETACIIARAIAKYKPEVLASTGWYDMEIYDGVRFMPF